MSEVPKPEWDVTAELKRLTNGCGADVVLDAVGGCSHHSYPESSGPMAGAVFGRIAGASQRRMGEGLEDETWWASMG